MNGAELVLLAVLSSLFTAGLVRKAAPALTTGLGVMAASVGILIFAPLDLSPMSIESVAVILVGVLAVSAPIWLPERRRPSGLAWQGQPRVALARLLIIAVFVLAATLVGFRAFIESVQAVTGTGFDSLTIVQIRAAQNGAARGGGLLVLLGSLGSLLGCLGIYAAVRFSWAWLVLPALSVVLALQNPSRLNSISLFVVLLVFYLYVRRIVPRRRRARVRSGPRLGTSHKPTSPLSKRVRMILIVAVVLIATITVFNTVGAELGKNDQASAQFPNYSWPAWTLSPFYYFAGGFSAFSQALQGGASPFDPGSSFFSVLRVLSLFGAPAAPNTIGDYVSIPGPFNLYTGPGQLYFDAGIFGTVLVMLGLGLLVMHAHRRAVSGYIEWAWASSLLFTVLVSFPQSFILFHLDVDFELLVGFVAFLAIRRSGQRSAVELDQAAASMAS